MTSIVPPFPVIVGVPRSGTTMLRFMLDSHRNTNRQRRQQQRIAVQPQLSYGVSQIVQLAQAKVGDDTIIAYIKNSGNSYGLTVDQIIYLRHQGISDAVITTMLNQPKPAVAVATPTTPAPQPVASSTATTGSGSTITTASGSTATVAPMVTYVQTASNTLNRGGGGGGGGGISTQRG